MSRAAWANCTTSGNVVTCDTTAPNPYPSRIGNGPNSPDGVTVNVAAGAQINAQNSAAISLRDNAVINLGANSSVHSDITVRPGDPNYDAVVNGLYATNPWNGAGPNTIEFHSNNRLTVGVGATVSGNGDPTTRAEAINIIGFGNTIINYGTISSISRPAIWFQDEQRPGLPGNTNTIDNYGTISTGLGGTSPVIGNNANGNVIFTNRAGAQVIGSLQFAGGNDQLTLEAGSVITGNFDGGGGTNALTLSGAAGSADSLAGDIRNFQTLTKTGGGRWTLTGSVGANGGNAPLQMFVNEGTLALTGNNANFNGSVRVDPAGILEGRAQSLPPTVTDNGLVRFVQDTAGTYSGLISGTGAVEKNLGGDLTLAGANTYSGGTTINGGTLFISSDANLGAASGGLLMNGGYLGSVANVTTSRVTTLGPRGGGLNTASGTTLTHAGTISGSGSLTKTGSGTAILTANNGYTGGTAISQGVLQIASNANLGAANGLLGFAGGTLRTTADMSMARTALIGPAGGTLETVAGTTLTYNGLMAGSGTVTKTGAGTLILTATNSHGGTAINGGVVQIASNANLGAPGATVSFDGGTLRAAGGVTIARPGLLNAGGGTIEVAGDPYSSSAFVTFSGTIGGAGGLNKTGTGSLLLTGNNSYAGPTNVTGGFLFVDGDQSAATGPITVSGTGTRLSGAGIIGGDVVLQSGASFGPAAEPNTPATLTINGNLSLASNTTLLYNVIDTTVGGALNDLTVVHGNLTLDGKIDVVDQSQTLGPGVYRIINYDGTLTDNGLDIGSFATVADVPTRPLTGLEVQTAIQGQVNLINTTGLSLNYWDGSVGPKNEGLIQGGNGIWYANGPDSNLEWTDSRGAVNAPWADGQFAVFVGRPGLVTTSNADGALLASGMQFGVNGYLLQGDPITLVDSLATPGEAVIRVGDGTARGAQVVTMINSPLMGSVGLRKTDGGRLILGGSNTYTGGTAIDGGTLQIASDAALGAASGALSFDSGTLRTTASIVAARDTTLEAGGGTFDVASGTTLTLNNPIGGAGALTKVGDGTLLLQADGSYTGDTRISAGTLQLGSGGTGGRVVGNVLDNAALVVNRSDTVTLPGTISGTGTLAQAGSGTTILTGNNSYAGGTTISAGTLQLGNGGTSGSITGNVANDGVLAFNRSDQWTLDSLVTGTGSVVQNGDGVTILTGDNSYAGTTTIARGYLYINGNQSGATGLTSVAGGARLGGDGIVGGNVTIADNGTLAPGHVPGTAATLRINGDLALSAGSLLAYNVVQANVAGGELNDLTVVGGNLTLDGTVNVVDTGQQLTAGIYRLINYTGTLTDNGLTVGTYSPDGVTPGTPITDLTVQVAVRGQVNLVSNSNLALTYWDGPTLPKNNNFIDGGTGIWNPANSSTAESNFTGPDGGINAPWSAGGFAIFTGASGTVTVDAGEAPILISGLQFATDGYVLQGDALTLVGGRPQIRVGDGTPAGADTIATIDTVLSGGTGITKTDLGTLVLGAANAFTGGVTVNDGTVQVASDANLGGPEGRLVLDRGALRTTASFAMTRPITLGPDGGTFEVLPSTTLGIGGETGGDGSLAKTGDGTLLLTVDATYTGGTTISAGTLQLGAGGTSGSFLGDVVDEGALVFNRSDALTFGGVVSGGGSLSQIGVGTTILTADNLYSGGTTIGAGTLQLGAGGTSGSLLGDVVDGGALVFNRSDALTFGGIVSGSGSLSQIGSGTTILTADNLYTGGTTISAGTLQLGDGGTSGSLLGDVVDDGTLVFNRGDALTFGGVVSGSGSLSQIGSGTTILTADNSYTGGTTIGAGTLQLGDGGTSGSLLGDVVDDGAFVFNRSDALTFGGIVSGSGTLSQIGSGTTILTADNLYTGGTTIDAGTLQLGAGGTSGSLLGDVLDDARLVVERSDSLLLNGVISGAGSFEQAGDGTTVFGADNSYAGGTTISAGRLQLGNGGTSGSLLGDVVDHGTLIFDRSDTLTFGGVVSGSGSLVQTGLGTVILTGTNGYTGGTAIEAGTLQISSDTNLGAVAGPLRIFNATLATTADIASAREVTLTNLTGTIDTADATTLTLNGIVGGAGGLRKAGGGTLVLTGQNNYVGETTVAAGILRVNGDQTASTGLTSVSSGAVLGGAGIIGGDVTIADGGTLAPGNSPGTLTINGNLTLSGGSVLDYEFGAANVVGGAFNDLTVVGGNLVLDGTINVATAAGGSFDPGVYRVVSYAGTLTDNGLQIGSIPSASYYVQTSVANQVNLVNTAQLTLNYWDGAAGIRSDGVIAGGDGVWQNVPGNDNWTTISGTPNAPWTDAAFAIFSAAPGVVTVDDSLGAVSASGMQFASDGYLVQGKPITLIETTGDPGVSTIRVGDGTAAGALYKATIGSTLTGAVTLEKTDSGTLVLAGANSYTGGTQIHGGVLQISSDANLGAADGALWIDGGTLRTTADVISNRAVFIDGPGTILVDPGTAASLNGAVAGAGDFIKSGAGTLVISGDGSGHVGAGRVTEGTLVVDGTLGSTLDVQPAGRLEGTGRVASVVNSGTVAPGHGGIGTLTVAGDYIGNNGNLEIEAVLGADNSPADRLAVIGATSGSTLIHVVNRGGLGALTTNGIRIVEVGGASDGAFALAGDYLFDGSPAVIAGAYGYRLYKNGVASPDDGDWYLRSSLVDPGTTPPEPPAPPEPPSPPLLQPGTPVYEAYPETLQALNSVPTLQQRVGNRDWAGVPTWANTGPWLRTEGRSYRPESAVSTSMSSKDIDTWQLQAGLDGPLGGRSDEGVLIGGLTVRYARANAGVRSVYGNGHIDTRGSGVGATLTWYGRRGFYIDEQLQMSWYDSDLKSHTLGDLARSNEGKGQTYSLEVGKRTDIDGKFSITPQAQVVYSTVDFEPFTDPFGAVVSSGASDSFETRWGISLDRQNSWVGASGDKRRNHLYAIAKLAYEWRDGTRVEVSGTPLENRDQRLWGELGLGASYSFGDDHLTLYGELSADTSFKDAWDSYGAKGVIGFRATF